MSESICPLTHHKGDTEAPRESAPGALLCHGHVIQSRRALETLPGIYEQLAAVAIPSGQRTGGPRSADKPLPYRESAASLRIDIRTTVVSQARNVAEDRQVSLPQGNGFDDVELACRFLRVHHDWTVGQMWADTYAGELRDLLSRARPILAPSKVRHVDVPVPCPLCTGQLKAKVGAWDPTLKRDDLEPPDVTCQDCGQTIPFATAQAAARGGADIPHHGPICELCPHPSCKTIRRQTRMVTWDDAWLWAVAHGRILQASTLRTWVERGHVATRKTGRVVLYSLPDLQRRLTA